MKISKVLLIGFASMALSCFAIAESIVIDVGFVESAPAVQKEMLTTQPNEVFMVSVHQVDVDILIHDYGPGTGLTFNSNLESNMLTANLAKEQNQNFERMLS